MSRRKQFKPRHCYNDLTGNSLLLGQYCGLGEPVLDGAIHVQDSKVDLPENTMDPQALAYHRYLAYNKLSIARSENQKHTHISNVNDAFSFDKMAVTGKNMLSGDNRSKVNDCDISRESGVAHVQSDFESDDESLLHVKKQIKDKNIIDIDYLERKDNLHNCQTAKRNIIPDKIININDEEIENEDEEEMTIEQEAMMNVEGDGISEKISSLLQIVCTLWQQQLFQCHMLQALRSSLIRVSDSQSITTNNNVYSNAISGRQEWDSQGSEDLEASCTGSAFLEEDGQSLMEGRERARIDIESEMKPRSRASPCTAAEAPTSFDDMKEKAICVSENRLSVEKLDYHYGNLYGRKEIQKKQEKSIQHKSPLTEDQDKEKEYDVNRPSGCREDIVTIDDNNVDEYRQLPKRSHHQSPVGTPLSGNVTPHFPFTSGHAIQSALFQQHHMGMAHMPPFGFPPYNPFQRPSILPCRDDEDDDLEEFMEVDNSEANKLEEMVKNIETKLTDPNQCIICKRILSCKSALQMHYRIHTGERPFKCKICQRAFTTKGNLKTHLSVHRIKPPIKTTHECFLCQRQFINPFVLQQHLQSHASEMPRLFPSLPGLAPPMLPFPFPNLPFPPLPFGFPRTSIPSGVDVRGTFPSFRHLQPQSNEQRGKDEAHQRSDDLPPPKRPHDDAGSDNEGNNSEYGVEKRHKAESDDGTNETTDDEEVPRELDNNDQQTSNKYIYQNPVRIQPSQERSPNAQNVSYGMPRHDLKGNFKVEPESQDTSRLDDMHHPNYSGIPHSIPPLNEPNGDKLNSRNTSTWNDNESQKMYSEKSHYINSNHIPATSIPFPRRIFPFSELPPLSAHDFSAFGSKTNASCDICLKTFACKSALDIHYRSHTKEKPFNCELCDRAFSTRGNMKQHMLAHSARELQSINFNPSSDESSRDTQNSLSCQTTQSTMGVNTLRKNVREYPPSNPFVPNEEPVLMQSSQLQASNVLKHSLVGESTGYKSEPKREPVVIQPEIQKPVNPVQPLVREMDEAMFLKHPNLKHMCKVCHKPFSSSSALQIHMRTHTGERPFRCTACEKAFTTKGNLKVHMSTHEDRSSFCRRGRRMSVDGSPPFDSPFPPHFPYPHRGVNLFSHPGIPPRSLPQDLFLHRFPPLMSYPPVSRFLPPPNSHPAPQSTRPNEIPVIQIPSHMRPMESRDSSLERSEVKGKDLTSPDVISKSDKGNYPLELAE